MTSSPGILIGDVLAGKYEVVDLIGRGGMGIVLEAVHQGLGQRVAIKVLRRNPKHDVEMFARFEREARAAAQLKSRHTVKVNDVDHTEDGTPFMVMELLEGHDLDAELGRAQRLEPGEAVTHVLQACTAMAEAHAAGIIHRDLKPQNLFLCREGNETLVKVLDFGISKITDDSAKNITQTASALGTPLYMSPEQIRSAKHVDARTDIWSLGVILYELLTGRPPFEAESPTAVVAAITADAVAPLWVLRQDLPRELSDVVMKALEKRPVDRYPDIVSFAAALSPFGKADAFARPSMQGLSDAISRTDLSAPGLAATLPRDTDGSWETAPLKRPLARSTKAVVVGGVVASVVFGGVWLTMSDSAVESQAAADPSTPSVATPASNLSTLASPVAASSSAAPSSEPSAEPAPSATASPSTAKPVTPPAPRPSPRPTKPKPAPTATTQLTPPTRL